MAPSLSSLRAGSGSSSKAARADSFDALVELLERGEMVEEEPGIYELGIGF